MTIYTGSPKTWVAGENLTAADFNAEIRDPLAALAGAWTAWTTTVSQGTATSITHTRTYAKHIRIGKLVMGSMLLAVTQNGGGSGAIRVTVPVAAATSGLIVGSGTYYNQDGTNYPCIIRLATTGLFELLRTDATTDSAVGTSPAIECSNGDYIKGTFIYEAA